MRGFAEVAAELGARESGVLCGDESGRGHRWRRAASRGEDEERRAEQGLDGRAAS